MLEFHNQTRSRSLKISDGVLEHLMKNKQKGLFATETGGQLFAEFSKEAITIVHASGPRIQDKRRTRFSFAPSRQVETKEIDAFFKRGLHFVGDWHTHPESRPIPSQLDLESMAKCYLESIHNLDAFVMIIVGTDEFPHGLWIGLHNANGIKQLLLCERQLME